MAAVELETQMEARPGLAARIGQEIGSWSATLKIGLVLMAIIVLLAVFAPLVAPFDPDMQDFDAILEPPGLVHLFGTDNLGRDIFSRVLFGSRLDLLAGLIMTYVPFAYGVMIGAYSGYRGGWVDAVVNTVINVAIAFPFLVLIIVVVAVLGPGIHNIYISVFLLAWTMYARLARAEMMVERAKDYVLAARVLGFPTRRILLRHALPNIIGSSIVFSMSDFVLNILLLSGLSFIGLGIQPPIPEWGAMIAEGKEFILQAWWICTMPGLAVVLTGTALSLIGDGLARRLGDRHTGLT
ncbi:ABC transporter permease [Labrys monachus]|uniref:Peptide/nickel transport system permease protein n=1 Tax=Labrys monachus TaxID=217067 RepID=A0ABU0FKD7_9HYPH|nr:ABC transporter permease [Labrys monachus]MDQ0394817.1 peptide/nickel transport system permease protein [Labrys monachus]